MKHHINVVDIALIKPYNPSNVQVKNQGQSQPSDNV